MSDDNNVVPFRRRGRRPPAPFTPPAATPPAPPPAVPSAGRRRVAELAAAERARYATAANRQREEELLATGRPVPARITIALDSGGHEGPEVDEAVGTYEKNPAGDVDVWECGLASPTGDQVKLLAELTGFPVAWFYEPFEPGPIHGAPGRMIICYRRKVNGRKCHVVEQNTVDEHGVLHYGGEPPRKPPAWWKKKGGQGVLF